MCSIMSVAEVSNVITEQLPSLTKLPLFGPDQMPTGHYGLFRDDNGKCVGPTVKRGYVPHTLDDIAAGTQACLQAFGDIRETKISCHWSKRGHEVIIAPSKEHRRAIFGTTDNIFPRVKFGGYLGGCYEFECGIYRDACKNLSIPRAISGVYSVAYPHRANLRGRIDELTSFIQNNVNGQFEAIATMAQEMEARKTAVSDFLAELYPEPESDSESAKTRAKNRAESILSRLVRERAETGRPNPGNGQATVWELVNAVTGYVQWDKTRRKIDGAEPTMLGRAMTAIADSETDNAWNLAVSLAS